MLNHRRRSTGRACRALAVVSGIIIIAAVFVTNLRTRDPISKNAAVSAIVVDAESGRCCMSAALNSESPLRA